MKTTFKENILYFEDFYHYNQNEFNFIVEHFSNLRNYHHHPDRLFPWLIFANEVAKAANFSLILKPINYTTLGSESFPTLISALSESKPETKSPLYFWNLFKNHSCHETQHNHPIFISEPNYPYNIAYCDTPKIENDLIWDLSVFLSPFGIYTWFAIFTVLVVVSAVNSIFIEFSNNKLKCFLSCQFFPTLNTLLSPSIGMSFWKVNKNSKLLILWTFTSVILVTFYLGVMCSKMIKPSPFIILKNSTELHKNNYTLIYLYANHLELISSVAHKQSNVDLINLLETSEVHVNESEFINELAFGNKKAVLYAWTAVCHWATMAIDLIHKQELLENEQISNTKACFVGLEMISPGKLYYGFIPPNHNKLAYTMQLLFDTGIYNRWMYEYIGLATASRVQDRVKLKSPTKLVIQEYVDNYGNKVPPLKLKGKMLKAFVLYGVCVLVCNIVLTLEIIQRKFG